MAASKRVALVIGNSAYQFGGALPNPGNDADRVAKAARDAGFDVTEVKDLGRPRFVNELKAFRDKANGAEIALFYYAGHGIEKDNANYLIPVDAALADPIDIRDEGVDLAYVIENLSKAERRIILLDACRDNPFKSRWSDSTRSYFRNGLGEMQPPFNTLVVFATAAGMKTPDGDAGGNSNFATALADQMPKPGVALQDFGPSVMDEVKKATGGQQQPYYQATLDSTKVFFIPPMAKPIDQNAQDETDWITAKAGGTVASYRLYKRTHPTGRHFDAAQERIDDLMTTPVPMADPGPARQPQQAYVPPPSPPPVVGPVVQAPEARPVVAPEPKPELVNLPPPAPAPAPPVYNPAPQPQVTEVIAPKPSPPIIQSPAANFPRADAASGTYVAPPIARQFGPGNFPIMPEPPTFDFGPYPTCKDNWQSVGEPLAKVQATIDCKNAYTAYKTNWLNRYRVAMNDYSTLIGNIYTNEVAPPRFPTKEREVQQFYTEMDHRVNGVKDGGFLMNAYEKGVARFNSDFDSVIDSYNRATGCKGYPTPSGLAPNPNC